MQKNIAVIPGDGVGPEVTQQAVKILDAIAQQFSHRFDYTFCPMGAVAIDKTGEPLPDETVSVCLDSDAILLGAIGHPKYDNDPAARVRPGQGSLKLRKSLGLFANVRPVSAYPSLQHLSPLKNKQLQGMDLVIFQELTGGIYLGKREVNEEGTSATDECIYTREEIERIARPAFQYAQRRRKKLTLVDKANMLETSKLWRKVVQELSAEFSNVSVEYMFVDNAVIQLVMNPKQFDVVLTENMFGDILSNEASVIGGSPGLLPSASIGNHNALFEPIHGSCQQVAGKDIANPVGAILSAAMMLDHFNMKEEAQLVRTACEWTLAHGFVSRDIDPVNSYGTTTIGDLVRDFIENRIPGDMNMSNISLSKSTII